MFHIKQTPPSGSFKLIEFETYYNKSNSPSFIPTKYVMVLQHGLLPLHTMLKGH